MENQSGMFKTALVAAVTTGVGDVLKLQNPEGDDLAITQAIVNVKTKSTGACSLNVGISAAVSGSSGAADLFSALNVGAAAGTFNSQLTSGSAMVLWPKDRYLVITPSSGSATGLDADLFLDYIHV
jgi:hypothetical protein